jgi:L-alanine-DL-glutamate epimerase-like enolase superfamily enzyme
MPQSPDAPRGRARLQQRFDRRDFLRTLAAGTAGVAIAPPLRAAAANLPKARITKVNIYRHASVNPTFNQSDFVVTVETDQAGLVGVGEGGLPDTLTQCAGKLIGRNPFDIERCWQDMYRSWFYSPGKEKIHALGALDMALWDIKGKALNVPVYDLMGGMNRDYVECYLGGGGTGTQLRENARAAMEQGYRAFRISAPGTAAGGGGRGRGGGAAAPAGATAPAPAPAGGPPGPPVPPPLPVERTLTPGGVLFNQLESLRRLDQIGKDIREGVGPGGDWLIDFHQRYDLAQAARGCKYLEPYEPYLIEDPTREENFREDIPKLRLLTTAPLAAGEQWGQRWDFNTLVERHDIDYVRCTLPNVGGITEMVKIAALCETHAVGIVPHFTGTISTAALVHALGPFSGPLMVEIGSNAKLPAHLSEGRDFRAGKLWPTARPGLGVTLDMARLTLVASIDQRGGGPQTFFRPDGSQTSW